MIRTLLIFLLLLASVCLGVQLHNDPGYVLIALNHWTIESTVWTMLATVLCVFFILHLFLLSLNWVLHLPKRWRYWQFKRSTERTIKKHSLEKANELKQMLTLKTTPEAYFTLGQLLEDLHDTQGASTAYREGLKRALSIQIGDDE
jgi:uncharacterized protein HemY